MARIIVIVLEGASVELLQIWRDRLPALEALANDHVWGTMTADPVPYEASGLATAFTGFPPPRHGYYSMWKIHAPRVADRPDVVDSGEIGVPYIWERSEFLPFNTLVCNIVGSHPPRPIQGRIITHPFYATTTASYPRRLLAELSRESKRFPHDVSVFFGHHSPETFKKLILEAETSRCAAYLRLLQDDVDISILNLTVIDRLSHFFWNEAQDCGEGSSLYAAYQLADRFVGDVLEGLRPDDELLVFSEIGFGPLSAFISVNDILAHAGLYAKDGQAPLPRNTIAFEAVQGSHGINLSLRSRYTDGIVDPNETSARLREIKDVLWAAQNPLTGSRLFSNVSDVRDLFGEADERGPDIVVLPFDERYLPLGDCRWAGHVSRTSQTGWHRRETFWAGAGRRLSSVKARPAVLLDIAPTIYELLGLDASRFPGCSLASSGGAAADATMELSDL